MHVVWLCPRNYAEIFTFPCCIYGIIATGFKEVRTAPYNIFPRHHHHHFTCTQRRNELSSHVPRSIDCVVVDVASWKMGGRKKTITKCSTNLVRVVTLWEFAVQTCGRHANSMLLCAEIAETNAFFNASFMDLMPLYLSTDIGELLQGYRSIWPIWNMWMSMIKSIIILLHTVCFSKCDNGTTNYVHINLARSAAKVNTTIWTTDFSQPSSHHWIFMNFFQKWFSEAWFNNQLSPFYWLVSFVRA